MNVAVQEASESSDATGIEEAAKLVLLVEDDEAAAEELSEVLELEGWRTLTARNVPGAMAVIENTEVRLVVTDVHLGGNNASGESGIHLVSRSMAMFPERDLSFIVLSGDVDAVKSSLQTDAVDFLLKPVAPVDLINTINEALRWSGKERNLSDFAEYLIQKTDRDDGAPRPALAILDSSETDDQRRSEATTEEKGFVLKYALASANLHTNYLPVMSFEGDGLICVEAVPFWSEGSDAEGDMQTFLDNARSAEWAEALDGMMRRNAIQALSDQKGDGHEDLKVIASFRAGQVAGGEAVEDLLSHLAAQDVPPDKLVVEVVYDDELAAVSADQITTKLSPFAARILRVPHGNFAAACAFSNSFATLGLDWLRIGIGRNTDWETAHDVRAEIRALIAISQRVGVKVIVDDVDTPEALAWLQAEGCDAVQGEAVCGALASPNLQDLLNGDANGKEASA